MNTTQTAVKTTWKIDPTHSEVQFKVKHLVISTVTGHFKKFNGSLTAHSDDFNNGDVAFEVDTKSIDTNVADRDNHLKSDDFFATDTYPTLNFNGKLNKVSEENYTLTGNLTIKETTKLVTLNVTYGGRMVDPYGQEKVGFEVTGKINRKEFGLNWNAVTEAGGIVVGDEVKLLFNIQLVLQTS